MSICLEEKAQELVDFLLEIYKAENEIDEKEPLDGDAVDKFAEWVKDKANATEGM